MPKPKDLVAAIVEQHALYLKHQLTTLRRCLRCDWWMRSTGPDHRLCNHCKGIAPNRHLRVGERIKVCAHGMGAR